MIKYNNTVCFHPDKQIDSIVEWIKTYFVNNGSSNTKAVIGISGGKDSTVAAALLVKALGPDRVIGVLMPEGSQKDIKDSYEVCEHLGIKYHEINISTTMDALTEELPKELFELRDDNDIYWTNTPARIRMTTLYAVAGLVGGRVCHTGNASEAEIGYTTKYGDLAGDFSLLQEFTVSEVYAMGDALGLPEHLVHKTPSDGMSGKTDEEKIGLSYELIDKYIRNRTVPESMEDYERLMNLRKTANHKRKLLGSMLHPFRLMLDESGEPVGGYF